MLAARVCARRCAAGADPGVLAEAMEAAREATRLGSPTLILQANAGFHEAVAVLSGHALLQETLAPVLSRNRWMMSQTTGRDAGQQCQEHQDLVDAIVRGDEQLAGMIMASHVEAGRVPSVEFVAAQQEQEKDDARRGA